MAPVNFCSQETIRAIVIKIMLGTTVIKVGLLSFLLLFFYLNCFFLFSTQVRFMLRSQCSNIGGHEAS